jgi:hypothetical protein
VRQRQHADRRDDHDGGPGAAGAPGLGLSQGGLVSVSGSVSVILPLGQGAGPWGLGGVGHGVPVGPGEHGLADLRNLRAVQPEPVGELPARERVARRGGCPQRIPRGLLGIERNLSGPAGSVPRARP